MLAWQKNHIANNYLELIKNIDCCVSLLAHLRQNRMLSIEDVDKVNIHTLTPYEKSKRVIDILVTRTGAFDALQQGLEAGFQTGALEIMRSYELKPLKYGLISVDKSQKLGKGRFGTCVYKGNFGGRDVAVKVVREDVLRAEAEVEILKNLDQHENVVCYFFAEKIKKKIVIALELCFISLQDEVVVNLLSLDPVDVLRKCTKGVLFLHKNEIVHRDIKPANILLTKNGQVKISDFGFAKRLSCELSLTTASGVYGTYDWMAPEVLSMIRSNEKFCSSKNAEKADIFSLGCVYYFALTNGKHPFGEHFQRTFNILENCNLVRESQLPDGWKSIIIEMIDFKPSARPDCEYLLQDACFNTKAVNLDGKTAKPHCPSTGTLGHQLSGLNLSTRLSKYSDHKICKDKSSESTAFIKQENIFELTRSPLELDNIEEKSAIPPWMLVIFSLLDNQIVLRELSLNYFEYALNSMCSAFGVTKQLIFKCAINIGYHRLIPYYKLTGLDIMEIGANGLAPIHMLCPLFQNLKLFKLTLDALLKVGADINAVTSDGNSLFMLMSFKGSSEILSEIISAGGSALITNKDNENALHLAMLGGNYTVISYLVKLGLDINHKNNLGKAPILYIAQCKNNFDSALQEFLRNDADFNTADNFGGNLFMAVTAGGGSADLLDEVMKLSSNWMFKNRAGMTALHYAVLVGNFDIIDHLVTVGLNINEKDYSGYMPVHHVAFTKNVCEKTLKSLQRNSADINAVDAGGNTLFLLAAFQGKTVDELAKMVELGANWNSRNKDGNSAISMAVKGENAGIIGYLTQLGININGKCNSGYTPLLRVAFCKLRLQETLNSLLENCADVNGVDANGNSLLLLATYLGRTYENLTRIVEAGVNWNSENNHGNVAIHAAAAGGNYEIIKSLVDFGFDINCKDHLGWTPIMRVVHAKKCFSETLHALLENGADINAVDYSGNNMFCNAVSEGVGVETLTECVNSGVNWRLNNNSGCSALDIASESGNFSVISFLVSLGLDINNRSNSGMTPIFRVMHCEANFQETLEALLNNGADTNAVDNNGNSLIFQAIAFDRSTDEFDYLISKEADWKIHNNDNETVLHVCANRNRITLFVYFLLKGADPHWLSNKEKCFVNAVTSQTTLEELFKVLVKHEIGIDTSSLACQQIKEKLLISNDKNDVQILRKVLFDDKTYKNAKSQLLSSRIKSWFAVRKS